MALSPLRRTIATICALVATAAMYRLGPYDVAHGPGPAPEDPAWYVLWLPVLLLGGSAVLVQCASIGAQLLARAVWWSNLILATIVCCSSGHTERIALAMALGSGLAILVGGRAALEAREGSFVPVAFRGSLTAILVMALADVQSLVLFGALAAQADSYTALHGAVGLLSVAVAMSIAVYGLYRLRLWGLVLTALTNIALILVALYWSKMPPFLVKAYVGSAAIQLALMAPLAYAILRRRGGPPSPGLGRAATVLSSLSVVALMAISLYLTFGEPPFAK